MLTAAMTRTYREYRRYGYPAAAALGVARADAALAAAEADGRIAFVRDIDELYDPKRDTDMGEEYEAQHARGEIETYVITAYVPLICESCGHPVAQDLYPGQDPENRGWTWTASLGGVDVYTGETHYLREVEIDLAREAGVIA